MGCERGGKTEEEVRGLGGEKKRGGGIGSGREALKGDWGGEWEGGKEGGLDFDLNAWEWELP